MYDYYELDAISIILNKFKVNSIIYSGLNNIKIMNLILKHCINYNASYYTLNLEKDFVNNSTLHILENLKNYDAIFLNDDPNWYTVYNELQIINETNDTFPLVFICHNVFPNQRRDSYINPEFIPKLFLKEYSNKLNYKNIALQDSFYHAIEENSPQNGVLTAIQDFISNNKSIKLTKFKVGNGITILYPDNEMTRFRLGKLEIELENYRLNDVNDEKIENQIMEQYINKNPQSYEKIITQFKNKLEDKNKVIQNYKEKSKLHDAELNNKNSQINVVNSKLLLKDSEIKNFKTKLNNRENEIKNFKTKLNNRENEIDLIKQQYMLQLSKLDSKEYCIDCYKREINNNTQEIQYLKKHILTKKLLNPIAYLYLFIKSKPNELSLNFKLYKALKCSKCFDIGFYLNNNQDLIDSKFCKYFSPELHYVCNGFKENRDFNKKYYNKTSKKELLDYILNCDS